MHLIENNSQLSVDNSAERTYNYSRIKQILQGDVYCVTSI